MEAARPKRCVVGSTENAGGTSNGLSSDHRGRRRVTLEFYTRTRPGYRPVMVVCATPSTRPEIQCRYSNVTIDVPRRRG